MRKQIELSSTDWVTHTRNSDMAAGIAGKRGGHRRGVNKRIRLGAKRLIREELELNEPDVIDSSEWVPGYEPLISYDYAGVM